MYVQLGVIQPAPPPADRRRVWFYSTPGLGADANVGPAFDLGEFCRTVPHLNHIPLVFPTTMPSTPVADKGPGQTPATFTFGCHTPSSNHSAVRFIAQRLSTRPAQCAAVTGKEITIVGVAKVDGVRCDSATSVGRAGPHVPDLIAANRFATSRQSPSRAAPVRLDGRARPVSHSSSPIRIGSIGA
jgi:hypothetical protein